MWVGVQLKMKPVFFLADDLDFVEVDHIGSVAANDIAVFELLLIGSHRITHHEFLQFTTMQVMDGYIIIGSFEVQQVFMYH